MKPTTTSHPLDPITPEEMSDISLAIKHHTAKETDIKLIKFMTCNLAPAPKKQVLAFLGIPIAPGQKPEPAPTSIARRAELDFIDLVTGDAWNCFTTLTSEGWTVDSLEKLPVGVQPQITVQELILAEETIRKDPKVIELAAAVGVTPEQLHADGWSIGFEGRFPESVRLQQCLLFARYGKDENLYAHPLDFIPVIDSNKMQVIHIDFPAHRVSSSNTLSAPSTAWPALDEDPLKASGRERIPPPLEHHDFLPDLLSQRPGYKKSIRPPVKPLHVVQPDGVGFTMNGNELEWQNWKLHVAFSHREGIALSTVTYNDQGEIRPILYRLSLVEMVVPYAAPEHPHPRKFAFDVGEYGMGTQANELSLGCDCLGKIHYLPGSYIGHDGTAIKVKNAICIHEEDAGLLWKHTDFRPGGRVHSVRSRRLVISMICTVANYEYCFYYHFYQDGTIELEIRLTGILNVYLLAENESGAPFGTQVAPRINAQNHQHIFSMRIDPMIDGLSNSVLESDIVAVDAPTGSAENFAGNAFYAKETVLKSAKEGARLFDAEADRRWTIINPARKHYSSGRPVGYTLGHIKGVMQPLLGKPDSWAARRASFATKALWVVKEKEEGGRSRMYPSGRCVPQTKDAPEDSVGYWVKDEGSIADEDIVLFLTIGVNHIPRPEDWPVMPVEHMRFNLRPIGFFQENPSLDVPSALDVHSSAAFADHVNGVNGINGVNGHTHNAVEPGSCCN
ncbi:peroxisomal copper amine oxidase [Sistotremastrum suecicum HHB10207 ss-3]|uniref:Amine oxidase n=1 Tax=Sistotremastrum suecicum HHB10207 ss-3 TaxID=1314776 RepID=A0A166DCX7_9AGAM|nr:peroxisomal copper amine oxidase [Sistotremastrum suecicum HHB10207 ss-3]